MNNAAARMVEQTNLLVATDTLSPPGTSVVVGAAKGIGEAVARRLAAEPWTQRLVLADIDRAGVERLALELARAGTTVDALGVDLADQDSIDRLVEQSVEAERLAVVAGIFASGPTLDFDRDTFRRVLEVNLTGAFFVAQGYARQMVNRGHGSIVGIASIAARMPRFGQAAYSASKAGMRQALRVLALEAVPRGVRVNTVSPGPTDTEMMQNLIREHGAALFAGNPSSFRPRVPDGRVAGTGEIAAAVSFLLSPDSAHIAFQDLVVDGGELLGM